MEENKLSGNKPIQLATWSNQMGSPENNGNNANNGSDVQNVIQKASFRLDSTVEQ